MFGYWENKNRKLRKIERKRKKNQEENKESLKIYYGISKGEINLFPYVSFLINPKKNAYIYIYSLTLKETWFIF